MKTISPSRMKSGTRLKPKDILDIAQEISTKYSPIPPVRSFGFTKRILLTSKQLLEISEEISRKYKPKLNLDKPKLVLLPIDPDHLYASWSLGDSKSTSILKKEETQEQNIVLRIYPTQDYDTDADLTKDWLEVAITPGQTRQKVTLPSVNKSCSFIAAIGKRTTDDKFTVITASEVAHRPCYKNATYSHRDMEMLTDSTIHTLSSTNQISLQNTYNASISGVN
jgi:hypothetical protein